MIFLCFPLLIVAQSGDRILETQLSLPNDQIIKLIDVNQQLLKLTKNRVYRIETDTFKMTRNLERIEKRTQETASRLEEIGKTEQNFILLNIAFSILSLISLICYVIRNFIRSRYVYRVNEENNRRNIIRKLDL